MSKEKPKTKPQILRPVKKTVNKKAGPTENISVELLKDQAVGDYLRVFLGSAGGTATEMILHHPIGVTNLKGGDWVLSTPEEVAQLKSRSKDPNYASIQAKRTEYIREKAVDENLLEIKDGTVFHYGQTDKMERSGFLDAIKKKALKEHEKEKNYKFILDLALDSADQTDPLVKAEKAYRKWVKPIQLEAEEKFPQTFRTMKGPVSDIPQVAISWLKDKKIVEAGPLFIKYGVTGPITAPVSQVDDDASTATTSGGEQWFFFQSTHKDKAKELKSALRNIRKKLSLDVKITIEDLKSSTG